MSMKPHVVVSGGFDDLRARGMRFLQEAAQLGDLTVLLWPDETLPAGFWQRISAGLWPI